ncbi:unnamed protein product [Allacma fusca]|uniref:Uncharacterized protein n=1 Tax=Allacma fusca TaxID=39272 RepID=A0A8J2JQ10_9HEXA|nr:unnamed protein product [Allacma fusca]
MKIYIFICIAVLLLESSDVNTLSLPQHSKSRESVRKQNGAVHFQTLKSFSEEDNNRLKSGWLPTPEKIIGHTHRMR